MFRELSDQAKGISRQTIQSVIWILFIVYDIIGEERNELKMNS